MLILATDMMQWHGYKVILRGLWEVMPYILVSLADAHTLVYF